MKARFCKVPFIKMNSIICPLWTGGKLATSNTNTRPDMKKTLHWGGRLGYQHIYKQHKHQVTREVRGPWKWVVTWGSKFSTEWNPWFLYEKFHETLTVASHASNMFDEWWTFFLFNLLTIGESCTPNSPKKETVKIKPFVNDDIDNS